jgi:hypothetical protein
METASTLHILGYEAHVDGPPDLVSAIGRVYPSWPAWWREPDPDVSQWFSVERSGAGPYRLLNRQVPVAEEDELRDMVTVVDAAVMTTASTALAKKYLIFHAGSVARDGVGMLLPATSGGGKSTLVAGLIAAGWTYYGDELAVVDPGSLQLVPVNRSLCLRAGSRSIFRPRFPELAGERPFRRRGGEEIWYVTPPEGAIPREPASVRLVVLPSYDATAESALTPITRSTALQGLLEQSSLPSFVADGGGADGGRQRMDATVNMMRQASCYALASGDLDEAVALLEKLLVAEERPTAVDL